VLLGGFFGIRNSLQKFGLKNSVLKGCFFGILNSIQNDLIQEKIPSRFDVFF